MPTFTQHNDQTNGRIRWTTEDETGDVFWLEIGPNQNDQTQLLIEWRLPDGSTHSRTV